MKSGFLSLHFFNELSDLFGRQRVWYLCNEASVALDLFVEFLALVTHSGSAFSPNKRPLSAALK
jgi:hypothetical protein